MSLLALIIDTTKRLPAEALHPTNALRRGLDFLAGQIVYRRAYFTISRMSGHLVVDMGLDPDDLKRSFRAKWNGMDATGAAAATPTVRPDSFAERPDGASEACAC